MDQDVVQDSLTKQLEVVERSLVWSLAIAVVAGWAGFHKMDPIEVLGIRTSRGDAYLVTATAFVLGNLAIWMAFLRMGDLLSLLDDSNFVKGVDKVMIHPSLFNPFAYFGSGPLAEIYSGIGLPLLILCWWGCYITISTLLDLGKTRSMLQAILFGTGILSVVAIHRFRAAMLGRLQQLNSPYVRQLKTTHRVSSVLGWAMALSGFVAFIEVYKHLWKT